MILANMTTIGQREKGKRGRGGGKRERERGTSYLIGQIIEMDNIAHHPNRLVEGAELIISVTAT